MRWPMGAAFGMHHTLMDKKITTLAEMPVVAGQTVKSFIGQSDRAKRLLRRTCALAVCLGWLLLGPVAYGQEEALAQFGKDLLTYVGEQVVESAACSSLNQLNNINGYGAGTLMGILGGGDYSTDNQLANISGQITVAQNMIASLQVELSAFQESMTADEVLTQATLDDAAYQTPIKTANLAALELNNVSTMYNSVISSCYTNNGTTLVLKNQLSTSDLLQFTNFVISPTFTNTPEAVLTTLESLSDNTGGATTIFAAAFTDLKDQVPFEHQTYASMYSLFNYVVALRAQALFFKKEYQSYLCSQQTNSNVTDWMNTYYINSWNSPGMNTNIAIIDADVANSAILTKMATLLTN